MENDRDETGEDSSSVTSPPPSSIVGRRSTVQIVFVTDHARRPTDELLEYIQLETKLVNGNSPRSRERHSSASSSSLVMDEDSSSMNCIMDNNSSSMTCFWSESSTSSIELEYYHHGFNNDSSSLLRAEDRWQLVKSCSGTSSSSTSPSQPSCTSGNDRMMSRPQRSETPKQVHKKKISSSSVVATKSSKTTANTGMEPQDIMSIQSMGKHVLRNSSIPSGSCASSSSSAATLAADMQKKKLSIPSFISNNKEYDISPSSSSSSSSNNKRTNRNIHEILDEALLRVQSSPR